MLQRSALFTRSLRSGFGLRPYCSIFVVDLAPAQARDTGFGFLCVDSTALCFLVAVLRAWVIFSALSLHVLPDQILDFYLCVNCYRVKPV
jgi:hypothetical protein